MDFDEIVAAAQETDPRKAFWLYFGGPTFATGTQDFCERVLPAVADLPLDEFGRAAWVSEFGSMPAVGTKYGDALGEGGLESNQEIAKVQA
jgi:hypothetical protein